MAGAAAYEINQPLLILLVNIEMLERVKDYPDKMFQLIAEIKESGEKNTSTIKKLQRVRSDKIIKYDENTDFIKLDQEIRILSVEDSDASFN